MRVPLAAVILVAEGAAAAGDGFDWSALATGRPLSLGPGGDGKVAEVADDEEGCLPPQQQGQQVAGGGGGATAAPYRPGDDISIHHHHHRTRYVTIFKHSLQASVFLSFFSR